MISKAVAQDGGWISQAAGGDDEAGGNESGAGADDRLAKGNEVVAGSVGGQRERFAVKVLRRIEIEVETAPGGQFVAVASEARDLAGRHGTNLAEAYLPARRSTFIVAAVFRRQFLPRAQGVQTFELFQDGGVVRAPPSCLAIFALHRQIKTILVEPEQSLPSAAELQGASSSKLG